MYWFCAGGVFWGAKFYTPLSPPPSKYPCKGGGVQQRRGRIKILPRSIGTVFPATERGSRTARTVLQEPEPDSQNRAFLLELY